MNPISDDDIVISGISGRFPNSDNVEEFWTNLINSREMYSPETERWPTIYEKLPTHSGHLKHTMHEQFDAELFDVSTDLANFLDPQQRLFYEATYEAIYDSGYSPFDVGGYRSGCAIGSCYNDTQFARFEELTEKATKFFERNAQFVCDAFNLKGVSLQVDTACAASFSALHQAIQAFKSNEVDRMIIGALAINQKPSTTLGFSNLRMLSSEGRSKCLDAAVDGYCRSEAIVAIFLQRRNEAKRIYATIYHSETNCDGYKPEGITFPSIDAQYRLIAKTYQHCKLDPERHITYVEGHITGTPVGDPIESQALVKALRPNKSRPILVGCLKSNMGHSEGASALCGLTKVALIFQNGIIPPNINYSTPNPNIEALESGLIIPVLENTPFDEDFICCNAFGFGGVNVHTILKANEKKSKEKDYEIFRSNHILPENWHLDSTLTHDLRKFDEFTESINEGQIVRLINLTNRTVAGCECAIDYIVKNLKRVNNDYLQLIEDLSFIKPETKLNHHAYLLLSPDGTILSKKITKVDKSSPLYLVFNGLGSQLPKIGNEILRIKVCARKLVQLSAYTKEHFDFDLIDFLCKDQTEEEFSEDLVKCSIAIFAIQVALIDLLKYLEIKVDGFIGYSIGEFACAYLDDCADVEYLLQMMYEFSTICKQNLEEGVMLSVGLSKMEVEKKLLELGLAEELSICCVNSNENTTIGGKKELIDQFMRRYDKELFLHKVKTCRQVFHAKSFEKAYLIMLNRYKNVSNNQWPLKKRSTRWITTSLNDLEDNDCLSTYLANNLNQTVHFSFAVQKIPNDACCLEIGSSCQLLPFVKQERGSDIICIPMLRKKSSNIINNLLIALGGLFNAGSPFKINNLFTKVKYPVSRETLSLSHLLKLDHSIPRFVYRFPEYYNSLIFTRTFSIRYDNPTFKNFYDHIIDNRILLPATSYLFLAWQSFAEKAAYNYKKTLQIPIEFFDINFRRAILLNKNTETVIRIKINEDNGNFCILESEQVCCVGRMSLIKDCEYKIDPLKLKPKSLENEELLVKSDVYKEFSVRGYDYQGDFQGIVEVYASGRAGKVRWNSSWIAFSDSLLQISILHENNRQLYVPTYIEYLRCESDNLVKYLENCTKTNKEPIFDVYYDPVLGMGATTGMLIKGLRVVQTPRKYERSQKPLLQKYCFVPYLSKFELQDDVIEKVNEYEKEVLKLIKGYRMKIEKLEQVEFDLKEFNKNFENKELYSIAYLMLDLLKSNHLVEDKKPETQLDENNNVIVQADIQATKQEETTTKVQKLDLNETIKKQQELLGHDFLFTNHLPLLLSNQLAIIMENINTKQMRVLEISFTFTLLYDYITMLLGACHVRTEYNLLHPIPVSKSVSSKYGINKVFEVKVNGKINKDVNPCHLVVYKHWSTSYLNSLETLDLSYFCRTNDLAEKELVKSSFEKLLDGGFLMFFYRKELTLIERQLMELGEQTYEIKMCNKVKFLEWILAAGFEVIGEEETDSYGLILGRKVSKELVQVKKETNNKETIVCVSSGETANEPETTNPCTPTIETQEEIEYENPLDPIPIEIKLFDYRWVERIQKELDKKSSRRIWLIAKDSGYNGIIGLVKSLKREPEGERIRCLFDIDDCDDEKFVNEKVKNGLNVNENPTDANELKKLIDSELIRKDLAINVIKNGQHGSYRQLAFTQKLCEQTDCAVLDILIKGDLKSFHWIKSPMNENYEHPYLLYPKFEQCINNKPKMIDIYYSALNFKDVMVASGRVSNDAYPYGNCKDINMIGMEASGILEDGRRVMTILPGSGIATKFVIIDELTLFDVPDHWSLAEAATVPVAYLTSIYSLIVRGKLIRGERVLIHAGSGGVGFAAISIALSYDCEVFTTVSTNEKKEFLQQHFPTLKDRNFANSRDVKFEEHILKETDGYGVDVVLNCLAEDKLKASLRCLAKWGRFLEIGKYDIMENNPLDTTTLGENRTLHVICLAHLYAETVKNPVEDNRNLQIWRRISDLLREGIKTNQVKPLNYTIFSKDEAEKAFHYMANSKHRGKILIEIKNEQTDKKTTMIDVIPKTRFNPLKVYIVTGGLGGFGLELALWLTSIGTRKLVLTSRFGIKTTYQEMQVRKIREKGATVLIINEKCDTLESTRRMLNKALELGPIGGIFHLAMVLQDSIFINQSREAFEQSCEPKINSIFFLDLLTRKEQKYSEQLDYFVCFSSVASALGNPGQCNYTFANSAMERIIEKRSCELNNVNLAIQWGAIADVGIFARKFGNTNVAGLVPQRIPSCLQTLDKMLNIRCIPIISCVTLNDESKLNGLGNGMDIVKTVMHLLGVQDTSTLDPNVTLTELGMDSLMAVEIKQALEREYDIIMTTQEIRNLTYKRLQELSAELEERKKNQEKDGFESEQDSLAKLDEIFNAKDDLFVEISSTTSIESTQPLFFIPSLQGDFVQLKKITKYITRPIVGINWLSEFDEKESIDQVACSIGKRLIEKYGTREFDFVGLSFGGVLVWQLALQLQLTTSAVVRKIILLNGAPDFQKARYNEMINQLEFKKENEEKIMCILLFKFTEYLIRSEGLDLLEEQLAKLLNLNSKADKIVSMIRNKFNYDLKVEQLLNAIKSMYRKMKMICESETKDKFKGDILLIRAQDNKSSVIANTVSESYGIEKICTGKSDVIKLPGDHSSFLSNNAKDIGHTIDCSTAYLSI